MENSTFPKKLKIELPHDLLLGIYPEKTMVQSYVHLKVYCSTTLLQTRHGSNLNVHLQMSG